MKPNGFGAMLPGCPTYTYAELAECTTRPLTEVVSLGKSIQISNPKQLPGSMAVSAVAILILLQ